MIEWKISAQNVFASAASMISPSVSCRDGVAAPSGLVPWVVVGALGFDKLDAESSTTVSRLCFKPMAAAKTAVRPGIDDLVVKRELSRVQCRGIVSKDALGSSPLAEDGLGHLLFRSRVGSAQDADVSANLVDGVALALQELPSGDGGFSLETLQQKAQGRRLTTNLDEQLFHLTLLPQSQDFLCGGQVAAVSDGAVEGLDLLVETGIQEHAAGQGSVAGRSQLWSPLKPAEHLILAGEKEVLEPAQTGVDDGRLGADCRYCER